MQNISAFSTTEIVQNLKLVTDQTDLTGRGPSVQSSITVERGFLRLFFTESTLPSLQLSWQWVDLLAKHMEINDPMSRNLLFAALTDSNSDNVYQQFENRGYRVNYTPTAMSGTFMVIER